MNVVIIKGLANKKKKFNFKKNKYTNIQTIMECVICVNKSRQNVTCLNCSFTSCKKCNERFILSLQEDAKCMNCSYTWNDDFIVQSFTKKFYKEYLKHKNNVEFENQKKLVKESQLNAELEIKKREMTQKIKEKQKEKKVLAAQQRKIDSEIYKMKNIIHRGNFDIDIGDISSRKCQSDNCKGYLKNTHGNCMSCSLCNIFYCKDCNELWDHEHVCNADAKASMKYIHDHSVACPTCGIQIQKSDGCNQMWCTGCHTAFSYTTGKIDFGHVHNPLYLEWKRRQGRTNREPYDYPCGGIPHYSIVVPDVDTTYISNNIQNLYYNPTLNYKPIDMVYNIFQKLHTLSIREYPINQTLNFTELRIKWMLGDMTNEVFKSTLHKKEMTHNKKMDVGYRLNALCFGIIEIFQRFVKQDINNVQVQKKHVIEFYNLRNIYNSSLSELRHKYPQLIVPCICKRWRLCWISTNSIQHVAQFMNVTYKEHNIDYLLLMLFENEIYI